MGHRFSKGAANNIAAKVTSINEKSSDKIKTVTKTTRTNIIPIPNGKQKFVGPTINFQIQESPTSNAGNSTTDTDVNNRIITADILQQQHQYNTSDSVSSSLTSVNNLSCGRQIIIKIQLAKMENGNETPSLSHHHQQQLQQDASFESFPPDCNLNSTELSTTVTAAGTQFLNLTLNGNSNCNSLPNTTNNTIATTTTPSTTTDILTSSSLFRTAGSSLSKNNNYLNSSSGDTSGNGNRNTMPISRINERPERLNSLQYNDDIAEANIGEIAEYCEVLEDRQQQQPQTYNGNCNNIQMLSINEEPDNETNVCCRRKSKSLVASSGSLLSSSNNTGAKTKSRCRKCSCREAFRRFLDPSLSRSSNKVSKQQKEQKRTKSQDRHSINNPILNNNQQQHHRNTMHSTNMNTNIVTVPAAAIVVPPAVNSQIPLWSSTGTPTGSDVIIPLTTPAPSQIVVVQCAIVNSSNATIHPLPTTNTTTNSSLNGSNMITIAAHDITTSSSPSSPSTDLMVNVPSSSTRPAVSVTGPIVHSQVDFVHYLVPDLERITNSSFYWGKMDRYEAERLLEGKPEGTFLLRDSAQEEFLFSVTFRKYGRSLHARIEQSEHRFSFDCHDPCVFTAPTVTGLLEHYKDPACVMFFEPMLTIPLHRKSSFSLQKLCRATIVSNTTYDGINELELPARLKSYLKEYHYKQKLRVKSNEPTYTLHCK